MAPAPAPRRKRGGLRRGTLTPDRIVTESLRLLDTAGVNAQIPLIVLNGADQDTLVTFQSFLDAHNRLVSLGVAHVLQVFSGDHSWFNFRREFVDFVTRL